MKGLRCRARIRQKGEGGAKNNFFKDTESMFCLKKMPMFLTDLFEWSKNGLELKGIYKD